MKDTAISKPINPIKIEKGIIVKIATNKLPENNLYKKVDNIFNNECPAHKLANNRTPNDNALAK